MSTIERIRTGRAAKWSVGRTIGFAAGLLACLMVGGLTGCVDASVDPSEISASLVSAGEFSLRDDFPELVESRTEISCELGRLFGVDYALEVAGGGSGVLPVQFRWLHPGIPIEGSSRVRTETAGGVSNPVMERGRGQLLGRSLWSIDTVDERVPGIYRFEIRTIGENRILLVQDFQINGC